MIIEDIKKMLKKHQQSHLLAFWGQLDESDKNKLLGQIQTLNFAEINNLLTNYVKKNETITIPTNLHPATSYQIGPDDEKLKTKYKTAEALGAKLISKGKVAAFVVAGGQGTRLGFDGPKGDFAISPIKNKTLFQLFAEIIAATCKKYNCTCPWYIMTSPLNYDETKRIFSSNNYFGLDEKNVFIFQQGTTPNFSLDGNILLADKANIACSPDGHGGSLKALHKSGAIEDMKKRGIEFVSYFQVDNPLINIFDPLFIGLHATDESEMSSKALIKAGPLEKVGNFCLVDNKIAVIEYSDLPNELAQKRNPDDSLVFELGSIAIHIINVDFIERLNKEGFALPSHRAVKKIRHIDEKGEVVEPTEPNGIKLETFVFDALPLAKKSIILQTLRREEFAPIKNADGNDSVETARKMMIERAADWLEAAGVTIPRTADYSADCVIEIAPSFALDSSDIKNKLDQIPQIKPGDKLYLS